MFWNYAANLGVNPCQSAISIMLQSKFIEITLWHGCSAINLLLICRTPLPENASSWERLWRAAAETLVNRKKCHISNSLGLQDTINIIISRIFNKTVRKQMEIRQRRVKVRLLFHLFLHVKNSYLAVVPL